SRPTRNALVRTAALYSRAATTNSLRMAVPPLRARGGDPDEDVVQCRPDQLKMPQPAELGQASEQCRHICPRRHLKVLPASEVNDLLDAREVFLMDRGVDPDP